MGRVWKGSVIAAGIAAALLLIVFAFVNTQIGQNAVAPLISPLTGGRVSVSGLSGRIPGALRARQVVLRDDTGRPWLVIDDAAVEGSIFALLANHIDFQKLTASRVRLLRLPENDGGESSTPRIDIAGIDLPVLETSAAISTEPMRFSAQGALHMRSLDDIAADIAFIRQDGPGAYRAKGSIRDGVALGAVAIDEAVDGLAAAMLGLNSIGPIKANARAEGPANANRISFAIEAGALHAAGSGTFDIAGKTIAIDFSASAPAMDPRDDLSWQSFAAEGHAHGAFDALTLDSRITFTGLRTNGVSASRLTGTATGSAGVVDFTAEANAFAIAGLDGKLFAAAPVSLRGRVELRGGGQPLSFAVTHPLLTAAGIAHLEGLEGIKADIALARLKPFAALAGIDLEGSAMFAANISTGGRPLAVALEGTIQASGGDATLAGAIGRNAPFRFAADASGPIIANIQASLDGAWANVQARGAVRNGVLDVSLAASVPNVGNFLPPLAGKAEIRAAATGPEAAARLTATLTGMIGAPGLAPRPVKLALESRGFRKPLAGTFEGETPYRDAPLSLSGSFLWGGNDLGLAIERGAWKSVAANGGVTIPNAAPFTANMMLSVAELADLAFLTGTPLAGSLDGTVRLQRRRGEAIAEIQATAHNASIANVTMTALAISGDVAEPFGKQRLALKLAGSGISAGGFAGTASADLRGVLDALAIAISGNFKDAAGHPAKIDAAATLRSGRDEIAVSALALEYLAIKAALARPLLAGIANGLSVDALVLRSGDSQFSLSGRLLPALEASVSLDNFAAASVQPFVPYLSEGVLSGSARLTGTLQSPRGAATLRGSGLRIRGAPAGLAPGALDLSAELSARAAQLDASFEFGGTKFRVTGQAPFDSGTAMNLHAAGMSDFSLLNAALSSEGRRLLGSGTIDVTLGGTLDAPAITGNAKIANAEFQDYARGLRITGIDASAVFTARNPATIDFTAHAGRGTITGSGTIDLAASGLPVNIAILARNAEPAASDALRVRLDADLTIAGTAAGKLTTGGKITVLGGELILPDSLPPSVASLDVIRPGRMAGPENPRGPGVIAFDLDVVSPGQFFVRGRGLDAELAGDIHLGGTAASPTVAGAFTMRRGTFDLGGSMLAFTTGRVTFDGDSLRDRIDPALDFAAARTAGGYTMSLEVSGSATNPKVRLTSTPAMPQDEILAQLLFQQNVKQLTVVQLAEIVQSAATLGGFGTGVGGLNPLALVRRTLGLDRLSVVGGANNRSQVEAGKYIASNIYVGARQGLSNALQAEVQVDLTKNLKAKATIATRTNATAMQGAQQQISSSNVGLSWQFEY